MWNKQFWVKWEWEMSVEMSAVSEATCTDFVDTSAPDKKKKKDVQGETVLSEGILQGMIFERFKKKGNYLLKSVITKRMNMLNITEELLVLLTRRHVIMRM